MPTNVNLDFSSAITGTILDKDGLGTGFTSVQANTANNAYDLGRIDLNTSASSLVLTATQGSNASANTLKNGLQLPINSTEPFTVSTRLKGPFTNLTTAYQQGGIFLGPNQDNYVKLVIINSSSGTNGLGLQFFQEQNGVRSSVNGGSASQVTGLGWASINTLDLFLTGDPATGTIKAAYRINSDTTTPTSLTQVFKPRSAATFFADETTARAGILAFAVNGPDTTVTFDSFSVKPASYPSPSPSPNFTTINWSTVAPSPIGRAEAQGAVVNGKLYVFGGFTDSTFIPKSTRADMYDPVTNTWMRIADMPIATTHAGTAVDGKDIYFAGGVLGTATGEKINASQDVWKYNVDTNTWTAMPQLPEARGAGELSLLGRELHYFGGTGFNREESKGDHWVLSVDGGTSWTSAAPLPNPRNHLGDAVIGGKIYAIGGQTGHNDSLVTQNSVHMWDPANPNTWTAVASLPRAQSHISGGTFVMDNRIIVAGGETAHGSSVSAVTAYDPVSNSWTALTSLPAARHSGVAGNIGNQIFYTIGSSGFQSTTYKGVPVTRETREALHRIDVGSSSSYKDTSGNVWSSDAGLFTPSNAIAQNGGTPPPAIANTLDDTLYQTYRGKVGDSSTPQASRILTFNLPSATTGKVDLRLHFAELYWGAPGKGAAGPGKRVFDVIAEGATVLDNFDITAASGGALTAVVVPIQGIQVNDGTLNLEFKSEVDFASVAAIEVLRSLS